MRVLVQAVVLAQVGTGLNIFGRAPPPVEKDNKVATESTISYSAARIHAHNRSKSDGCTHTWKHNNKIGCGQHGCGFSVTSTEGTKINN